MILLNDIFFFIGFLLISVYCIQLNKQLFSFGFRCCSLCAPMPYLLHTFQTRSEYIILFLLDSLYHC